MSLPYFPMYPTDFEAKTSHLTLEEDGAYNRLMRLMWMTPGCSLPNDDRWIMRRMRVDQDTFDRVVRTIIDEFLVRKKGRIFSPELNEWVEKKRKADPRPSIPLDIIRQVTDHYGEVCFYCGVECGPFEIDHVHPWSRGGEHSFENLVVSCRPCNRSKGAKTLQEWGGRVQ